VPAGLIPSDVTIDNRKAYGNDWKTDIKKASSNFKANICITDLLIEHIV